MLKVDDFAQFVIQLRPSIVKEEKKKFKLHEGDETSSEEEEDDDYGFESDDSEDIKAKNSIFNDTGLLPKSKPLTPTQILATKLTGPQRIALGLGNLNVFATEDSDYQYDSEDEYEETLADLRLVTPESCNSGAKRVLLDWLDALVEFLPYKGQVRIVPRFSAGADSAKLCEREGLRHIERIAHAKVAACDVDVHTR